MTNFGKLLLVLIIVVALGGTVYFLNRTPATEIPVVEDNIAFEGDNVTITDDSISITPDSTTDSADVLKNKPIAPTTKPIANVSVLGNKNDLVSFSIPVGSAVSGIQTATGVVSGGYFFEGNIIVRILDGSKVVLRSTYGTATMDWMNTGPVSFTTNLDFTGITTGPSYIEIHNDNPSGLPQYDKSILIPVVIQ